MINNSIPFVEAYRPKTFEGIVLDPLNKQLLKNVLETGYFPNLLFYGPPGTGKTTTIINLVSSYQEKYEQKNRELIIHLNASDERGIDTIRTQISQFVNSKTMFKSGLKFVILDEVDYMTKNAQQALRYLLQGFNNVRFCLICNYISRIDEGLQNEFLKLRFNQLPENDIITFLKYISDNENLNISEQKLKLIQKLYKSDMRSMINYIQTNQDVLNSNLNILDDNIWKNLFENIKNGLDQTNKINEISICYNVDKKNIIKDFFNYIIRNYEYSNNPKFLDFVENVVHFEDCNDKYYVSYSLSKLSKFIKEL